MNKPLLLATLLAAGMALPAASQAARVGVDINLAPPAPVVEGPPPPPPQPGYVWAPGYWAWNGAQYVWVAGHYVAGRPGWVWVPEHYVRRGPYYRFVPGHWRRG
ncbi:MAG TPA: hypothetical protein VFA75_04660 [Nevskia sp.]|nr:hypothetical protein [Nevskia sp.]